MIRALWPRRVHMKEVLSWFVRWARYAGACERFLSFLGCSSRPSKNMFFLTEIFELITVVPIDTASWAGSRVASPVSKYVSLVGTAQS